MPAGDVGKCLGYWWKGDLLASRYVEQNIQKAHQAFFHFRSIGVFQSDISPPSSREVIESCVMPVLLYGSENWILTDTMIERIESFQGELAKRVLKYPKHHSNTAANTALTGGRSSCILGGLDPRAAKLCSLIFMSFACTPFAPCRCAIV